MKILDGVLIGVVSGITLFVMCMAFDRIEKWRSDRSRPDIFKRKEKP